MSVSRSRSTTSIGWPCSSTPSAYRAQLATTAALRLISPPVASCWRTTGSSHFGIRSELCAHSRAMVSRMYGLEKRSISVCLYPSRSTPGTGQVGEVAHGLVAAVEQPQLHQLVRLNLVHELHPGVLVRRPPGGEVV